MWLSLLGVFAACVSLISESVSIRGFDISEPRDCAKAAVITALGFMALGVLDYPFQGKKQASAAASARKAARSLLFRISGISLAASIIAIPERHHNRGGCCGRFCRLCKPNFRICFDKGL